MSERAMWHANAQLGAGGVASDVVGAVRVRQTGRMAADFISGRNQRYAAHRPFRVG